MKVLIIYDSVYGNTEKIARAIAGAVTPPDEVKILKVSEAKPSDVESIDFLVIGSPTQGGRSTKAIQEFLARIPALKGVKIVAFDTRISTKIVGIFGYAAGRIAKMLSGKGGTLVAPPMAFFVKSAEGPLKEGELERATARVKQIIHK